MPLIQGGPPEWIWERNPDPLKFEIVPLTAPNGLRVYELRLKCGLEIVRLQRFTREELVDLRDQLDSGNSTTSPLNQPAETVAPETSRNTGSPGVVSDPDQPVLR